jgi:hypothetical protein
MSLIVSSANSRQRRAYRFVERYQMPGTPFNYDSGQAARFNTADTG